MNIEKIEASIDSMQYLFLSFNLLRDKYTEETSKKMSEIWEKLCPFSSIPKNCIVKDSVGGMKVVAKLLELNCDIFIMD